MEEQNIVLLKKKLLYHSIHRGRKEMDLILGKFVAEYLDQLSEKELIAYEALLELTDTELYDIISCDIITSNHAQTPDNVDTNKKNIMRANDKNDEIAMICTTILSMIKDHVRKNV